MTEPKYNQKKGVWECPLCGWTAMSKKVIKAHIQREHPEAASSQPLQDKQKSPGGDGLNGTKLNKGDKPNNGKEKGRNGKKGKKRRFKIGDTTIELWDHETVEVREMGGWRFFQNRNYVASLHGRKVRLELMNGKLYEGRLGAKDPFFVKLELENGRKLFINKGGILTIEVIEDD